MKLLNLFRKKKVNKTGNPVIDFYNRIDEDGRLLKKSRMPEYLNTMKYIEKYLTPDSKILEIGAGTGRYSLALAEKGFDVTSVELVPHNIDIMKKKIKPEHKIEVHEGNACDLSFLKDNTFDIVLLLGPMYHLFTEEDKQQALSEAIRVTKKGGIVFVAYCGNDATILQFCFLRGMLKDPRYRSLIDPVTFKADSDPAELFELHRKEDVDALRNRFPVTPLHYIATDGYAHYMRNALAEMDEDLYQTYLAYHFATCERQDMVGYSNHTLDIFRKD